MNREELTLTLVEPDSVETKGLYELLREKGYTLSVSSTMDTMNIARPLLFWRRFTDNDGYVQEVCSLFFLYSNPKNNPRSHYLEISHLRLSDDTFEGLVEQVRQLPGVLYERTGS